MIINERVIISYEAYKNKYAALRREKYIKSSKGKITLKSMLKEFINTIVKA